MPAKKAAKTTKKTTKKTDYSAENISVLEGLEPVRKRPGMYIGSTGPEGLFHMLKEIFDNSRDEAMAGHATEVEVVLLPDDVVRVSDNGRGIPVDVHKKTKVSALETIMTTLHAGGKFDNDAYKVSGGLHGVGASVVNALSEWATAEVHKDKKIHFQEYSRGKKKAKVKSISSTKEQGTVLTFRADREVFSETEYNWKKIIDYLRQQAYLTKNLKVRAIDARDLAKKYGTGESLYFNDFAKKHNLSFPSYSFYFEGGLLSLIKFYNQSQKHIHKHIFYVEKEVGDIAVEVALQYVDDLTPTEMSFANNIPTPEGGSHLAGFRSALTRSLNNYAKQNKFIKDAKEAFTGDDVREGITMVVSVKIPDPQFEGQTKSKLGTVEAKGAVESVFGDAFNSFLEENPDDAKAMINKVIIAVRARKAAKAAKDSVLRKGALEGMTLPGKLADCQTRSAEEAEIWMVEGDSAGGSAKQGRDRRIQAILPLRGKILNVERARLDKMLASKEIKAIVVALGTAIGDVFNIEKLRYHKIILAFDADVDGSHIRTLTLTLLFRYFRPLIEQGYVYVASPPLFKVEKGKEVHYAQTVKEKDEIVASLGGVAEEVAEGEMDDDEAKSAEGGSPDQPKADSGKGAPKPAKIRIQRYKGLGEMNPSQLWDTTMNPETRVLKKVTINDGAQAEKTFDMLMGNEVEPRKLFIQANAEYAELDV